VCCPAIAPFLCPMKDRAITGEKFYDCDICGFTYRISQTTLNSAGLRVCYEHCLDQGDYRFRTPLPYDIRLPILHDAVTDKYYQLKLSNKILVADEISNLGYIPIPYVVIEVDGTVYQLKMINGFLYCVSGVDGKRFPYFYDGGEPYYLFVEAGSLYYDVAE